MASSRPSSATVEWADVAFQVVAFEAMNQVKIVLTLTVEDNRGKADVTIGAAAHRRSPAGVEAAPLALVSVICSATRLRTLEAAVIHTLYILDGKLAEEEFERAKNQSA